MLWGSHKLRKDSTDSKEVAHRYQRSWRSQTARNAAIVEEVENLIRKDRRFTVRETAEQVEISTGSPRAILSDHEQNGCEICPQASVGGTEKFHLAVSHDLLDTIKS
ncbi:hypothetical protein TNCV_619871 [Trichonephila clavipes]|nr:hypothetical protein TNCV_619871 [Trichonephila clavipes]